MAKDKIPYSQESWYPRYSSTPSHFQQRMVINNDNNKGMGVVIQKHKLITL